MRCLDVEHERKLNKDLKKENQELLRQKRVAEAELAKTEKQKKKQVRGTTKQPTPLAQLGVRGQGAALSARAPRSTGSSASCAGGGRTTST